MKSRKSARSQKASKRTLEALNESIEHWRKNYDAEYPRDVDHSSTECALCRLFIDDDCANCPVAQSVGAKGCARTPYHAACDALVGWRDALGLRLRRISTPEEIAEARAAYRMKAGDELNFLITLRDRLIGA